MAVGWVKYSFLPWQEIISLFVNIFLDWEGESFAY